MTNKTELLPCPFCGVTCEGYPVADTLSVEGDHKTWCPFHHTDPIVNAANWNTRAAPAEDVRAVVEDPVISSAGDAWLWHELRSKYGDGSGHEQGFYAGWADCLRSQLPVAMPERLREIWLFLDGQAELEGCVFGEKPEGRHNFWWRKELRAALEDLYPQQ